MFELTPELHSWKEKVEALSKEVYGLDTFDVEFLLVPSKFLNQIASHIGFPKRYFHWSHGLEYERLKKQYDWGLGKIYELVINNDPSFAYLMENNSLMAQKLVMAHVYGHVAMFKNNVYFGATRRDMIDVIANNASRIGRHYRRYGMSEVESFLDSCISIQEHIDCFAPFAKKNLPSKSNRLTEDAGDYEPGKVKCDPHLDPFVNPEAELKKRKEEMEKKLKQKPWFPIKPQKDLLLFLLQYAPLTKWQEDILSIVRDESYYFNPQRQTKILNEGIASYYHYRMMTEHLLTPDEVVEFAHDHSGTLARSPHRINPYFLGFTLLRDIESRWDSGRFGKEFDDCSNAFEKGNWNKTLGSGYAKIKEVMTIENDYSFIDKYFTEEFCQENDFYKYEFNEQTEMYEVSDRNFDGVKNQMLDQLSNSGIPYIVVADGNFNNRGELLLMHRHEFDLNLKYARDTLSNIGYIWKRPVHLLTKYDDEPLILSHGTDEKIGSGDTEHRKMASALYAQHKGR